MRIAVFGLGYVGTVTSACLAAEGHEVWGVDVDRAKVTTLAAGRSPLVEPGLADLVAAGAASGRLRATTSPAQALAEAQLSLICVGTPSSPHGGADLTSLRRVAQDLARALGARAGTMTRFHAVVVRSTVPPGTVEELAGGLRRSLAGTGVELGAAMCPEFLREGTAIADFYRPPFTVIGASDPATVALVSELFSFLDRPVRLVGVSTAEALKYACNAFHATKIAFANEMGRIFRRLGVDGRGVMEIFCEDDQLNISDRYLRPGFAFGGSCLPKDLRSLLHLARQANVDLPLLAGALATNRLSVADIVDRVVDGAGRNVALLGLSFKSGSDDLRESPYVDLAETLLGKGFEVRIYDPIINPATLVGANRDYVQTRLPHLRRILTDDAGTALAGADVALVSTAAPEVIAALAGSRPPRIIDLNGRLGPLVEDRPGYEGAAW